MKDILKDRDYVYCVEKIKSSKTSTVSVMIKNEDGDYSGCKIYTLSYTEHKSFNIMRYHSKSYTEVFLCKDIEDGVKIFRGVIKKDD